VHRLSPVLQRVQMTNTPLIDDIIWTAFLEVARDPPSDADVSLILQMYR
jgi:hypothetical protein